MLECPNCDANWSIEEMDWGCHSCGYPNNDVDYNEEDEDIEGFDTKNMEVPEMQLKVISDAAIRGDRQLVCEILNNTKLNYRTAYIYLERFYGDGVASLLIQECGKCKCGSVAIKWNPEPSCANCNFHEALKDIQYEKPITPPDWWKNLYTDSNDNCYSDADPGL
jgi:hypothetical protein